MHTATPRILLLEDDPVSRAFLAMAAQALPAHVDCAQTLAAARALAAVHAYDLLLADAHLPDGGGSDLLHELRRERALPALAHTAATSRAQLDALIDAGFDEVLVKPVSVLQLQQAIRRVLQGQSPSHAPQSRASAPTLPAWDRDAALAAVNGQATQAYQLLALFLAELPGQRDAVIAALECGDAATLQARLHRLRGSCGFVGAVRMDAAVRALMAAPASATARLAFTLAVEETLASADAASG